MSFLSLSVTLYLFYRLKYEFVNLFFISLEIYFGDILQHYNLNLQIFHNFNNNNNKN